MTTEQMDPVTSPGIAQGVRRALEQSEAAAVAIVRAQVRLESAVTRASADRILGIGLSVARDLLAELTTLAAS